MVLWLAVVSIGLDLRLEFDQWIVGLHETQVSDDQGELVVFALARALQQRFSPSQRPECACDPRKQKHRCRKFSSQGRGTRRACVPHCVFGCFHYVASLEERVDRRVGLAWSGCARVSERSYLDDGASHERASISALLFHLASSPPPKPAARFDDDLSAMHRRAIQDKRRTHITFSSFSLHTCSLPGLERSASHLIYEQIYYSPAAPRPELEAQSELQPSARGGQAVHEQARARDRGDRGSRGSSK